MDNKITMLKAERSRLFAEISAIDGKIRQLEADTNAIANPGYQPAPRFRCVCNMEFGGSASELQRFLDHRFIVHPGEPVYQPAKIHQPTAKPRAAKTLDSLDDVI